jgi:hypothetical protein
MVAHLPKIHRNINELLTAFDNSKDSCILKPYPRVNRIADKRNAISKSSQPNGRERKIDDRPIARSKLSSRLKLKN